MAVMLLGAEPGVCRKKFSPTCKSLRMRDMDGFAKIASKTGKTEKSIFHAANLQRFRSSRNRAGGTLQGGTFSCGECQDDPGQRTARRSRAPQGGRQMCKIAPCFVNLYFPSQHGGGACCPSLGRLLIPLRACWRLHPAACVFNRGRLAGAKIYHLRA